MKHLRYIDLSMSRIRNFLQEINNPQRDLSNIIHIAGTNGKGSTASFIRSILEYHKKSVNMFTSPHLISERERIRVKGNIVSREYFNLVKKELEDYDSYHNLTIFESYLALAFVIFQRNPSDYTILETGLGGRLDATNIVKKSTAVITKIDYDHQDFLGDTLEKIAYEKAGIIKKDSQVFSSKQPKEVEKVLKKFSLKQNSNLFQEGKHFFLKESEAFIKDYNISLEDIKMQGKHQRQNALLSLAVARFLLTNHFNRNFAKKALEDTFWNGRLQKVDSLYDIKFSGDNYLFLDGAHNVLGMRALVNFIKDFSKEKDIKKVFIFLGMLKSKDLRDVLDILQDIKFTLFPLNINNDNAYKAEDIALLAKEKNIEIYSNYDKDIKKNLELITKKEEKKLIIICGSLYLLGDILKDNQIDIK